MADIAQHGARVAVTRAGRGAPVALLHCSASSRAQWRDLAAAMADRFSVIAPDLYGCGDSDPWPGRTPLRVADHARLLHGLIAESGRAADIVGHSFGGAVALRFALDAPRAVRRLVLIEPVAFHLLRGSAADRGSYAEIRGIAARVFECTLNGHGHAGMARFVDYWNGAGAWKRLPPEVQARLAAQIGGVAANFTALFAETSPLSRYRAITAPTLVLSGSQSPPPARRVAALVAAALPNATLVEVPGAGHMLPLTHADIVQHAILNFLAAPMDETGAPPPAAQARSVYPKARTAPSRRAADRMVGGAGLTRHDAKPRGRSVAEVRAVGMTGSSR